ncbi:MAG: hypothetical protein J5637_02270 [Prevotella sp.]|nr:hypothetical protein [Prevotella sp.]
MGTLRDYSKPLMVAEKFSADQYVAICTQGSQYLYVDGTEAYQTFLGSTAYRVGSDGVFQDARHANDFFEWLWNLIRTLFTGRTYTTDGEYSGIQTISNPTEKGQPFSFPGDIGAFPVYGSSSKLENGTEYPGYDLRDYLRITPNEDIYIQGNMS